MQGGGPPGEEEGRWEVNTEVRALAQEVQWLGHKCNEGNRNVTLLEDMLEWKGEETGWLRDKMRVEGYKVTLLRGRLM